VIAHQVSCTHYPGLLLQHLAGAAVPNVASRIHSLTQAGPVLRVQRNVGKNIRTHGYNVGSQSSALPSNRINRHRAHFIVLSVGRRLAFRLDVGSWALSLSDDDIIGICAMPGVFLLMASRDRRLRCQSSKIVPTSQIRRSLQTEVRIPPPQPASPYFYETLRLSAKYAPTRRIYGLKRCLRVAKPRTNARISASVSDSQFRYRVFISALCE
jgi:hypothetical protein